ncbi:MAG TPA: glutathione synthase [Gammaproteobacteria bacterium]|nr:glutathione synthase [Gammaproteobacteria bacterium]
MLERPQLGVIMDPLETIHPEKDTTLALLAEADRRGFALYYMELNALFLQYGIAWGNCRALQLHFDKSPWYSLEAPVSRPLDQFDILLMRKDPPVNLQYLYSTYILEHAESNGVLIVNKPQSLRDANEKLFATWFPQCMPPTLVSSSKSLLKDFVETHECVVFKPLDSMGGHNIFKCQWGDPNLTMIIDFLTQKESLYVMAQRFVPEITEGDKRILLIDGEPIPYALARIPAANEFRGNLAAGGRGEGRELTERDWWICSQIGPLLREKGLTFVGIDVIGEYLTEINVTSPTCVKELEKEFEIDIAGKIIDCLMEKLKG